VLNEELHELEQGIEECEREIEDQKKSIEELNEIGNDNMKECNRIIDHICSIRTKNEELAESLENL
jgi:uncharacterized coiled-coil protein SlyX